MYIIWIADYTTKEHYGGAQQTNELMVRYGRKIGHEVEYMLPLESQFSISKLKKADLVIINNLTRFKPSWINWIIENKPYIKYDHDHATARLIGKFPKLFLSSRLNIFLSPLHLQGVSKLVGYKIPRSVIIPPPMDTKTFKITNKNRIKDSVFMCGSLSPAKGINKMIDYLNANKEKKLFLAGWNENQARKLINMKNVTFLGKIQHDKLPEVYNRYESFILLPTKEEACSRVVLEAYLCGCRLITNKVVGAMSYKWDWKNYSEIKAKVESENHFWELINKLKL